MKHKVPWNRTLLEDFIKEGLLTEDEEFIMRTRLAGWSQVKQAIERKLEKCKIFKKTIYKVNNLYYN